MRSSRLCAGRFVGVSQSHFRVIDDRRQDIVEFVSDRRRQRTDRTEPLCTHQLLFETGHAFCQFLNLLCWVGHICRRLSAAAVGHLVRIGIISAFAAVLLSGISDKFKSRQRFLVYQNFHQGFAGFAGSSPQPPGGAASLDFRKVRYFGSWLRNISMPAPMKREPVRRLLETHYRAPVGTARVADAGKDSQLHPASASPSAVSS